MTFFSLQSQGSVHAVRSLYVRGYSSLCSVLSGIAVSGKSLLPLNLSLTQQT